MTTKNKGHEVTTHIVAARAPEHRAEVAARSLKKMEVYARRRREWLCRLRPRVPSDLCAVDAQCAALRAAVLRAPANSPDGLGVAESGFATSILMSRAARCLPARALSASLAHWNQEQGQS
jgi:hypothetical protein